MRKISKTLEAYSSKVQDPSFESKTATNGYIQQLQSNERENGIQNFQGNLPATSASKRNETQLILIQN